MAERKKYAVKPGAETKGGGPGSRGGFQKPKDAKKTFLRLIRYVTSNKLMLLLAFACVIINALGGVVGSYLIRPILNTLVEQGIPMSERLAKLGSTLLLMAVIYLVSAACQYLQLVTMARLAHRGVNRLRSQLFDKLQELPLSFFDAHSHGELMSRFSNDADNVQMCMEQSFVSLISSVITFVGIVAMMLYTCAPLFPITVGILAATTLVVMRRGKKSRDLFRAQQSALGQMNGNIQEMIEGLKVVKAFTHEDEAQKEFLELNKCYFSAASQANFYAMSLMPISSNISNIGYGVTAMFGGLLSYLTGFDIGGLAAFLQYSRQIGMPVNQISQQINTVLSALAGAERIFQIMDMTPDVGEGEVRLVNVDDKLQECSGRSGRWAWKKPDGELVEVKGDVRLHNVDFSYVPEKPVLSNVSLYAKPGQKIAFVGSTGAGKTTIANLINRFYEINAGSITYDGIDVRDIRKDDLRSSVAIVLRDTHLFTGTVMENIRYGRLDATDKECIAAAKLANAHSFIRRLPDGYNTMVTGDGSNLSQGQRQLLAIARAAVADPPVLVLDEATSSIDTRTERLIEKGLDSLMKDRTVFVIAHRLSTVRNSNCIVVIEKGEIVEKGNHDELLELKGRYHRLFTGQTQLD